MTTTAISNRYDLGNLIEAAAIINIRGHHEANLRRFQQELQILLRRVNLEIESIGRNLSGVPKNEQRRAVRANKKYISVETAISTLGREETLNIINRMIKLEAFCKAEPAKLWDLAKTRNRIDLNDHVVLAFPMHDPRNRVGLGGYASDPIIKSGSIGKVVEIVSKDSVYVWFHNMPNANIVSTEFLILLDDILDRTDL